VTAPEEPPAPSVSTAPAEGAVSPDTPLRRRRLPAHVGPARTSTVLLAVAFVLIGTLYLFVKPPGQADADPAGNDSPGTSRSIEPVPQEPATTAPSSTVPSTSEAPTPTESTTETPTTSLEQTSETPTDTTPETTAPEETTAPSSEPAPTTDAPTS
jgi:hypothetical protein